MIHTCTHLLWQHYWCIVRGCMFRLLLRFLDIVCVRAYFYFLQEIIVHGSWKIFSSSVCELNSARLESTKYTYSTDCVVSPASSCQLRHPNSKVWPQYDVQKSRLREWIKKWGRVLLVNKCRRRKKTRIQSWTYDDHVQPKRTKIMLTAIPFGRRE